ncbi:MAG: hypothetical protein H7096_07775 [Flavobacterium sp.]|nr:hypothetical protein [Pedobacter sp.]
MKKSIFTLIFAVIFSSLAFSNESRSQINTSSAETNFANSINRTSSNDRQKKRKLKKRIRQAGNIFRLVKTSKQDKKKSRKVQRKIRKIVNIW